VRNVCECDQCRSQLKFQQSELKICNSGYERRAAKMKFKTRDDHRRAAKEWANCADESDAR